MDKVLDDSGTKYSNIIVCSTFVIHNGIFVYFKFVKSEDALYNII